MLIFQLLLYKTGFVGSAEFVKIQPTYNNKGATTILLTIGMWAQQKIDNFC